MKKIILCNHPWTSFLQEVGIQLTGMLTKGSLDARVRGYDGRIVAILVTLIFLVTPGFAMPIKEPLQPPAQVPQTKPESPLVKQLFSQADYGDFANQKSVKLFTIPKLKR